MESSFINFGTDPLLLLKERIIKTETLLDKYACLTRKFNDLEKSHSQAIENEKKAKKDAIKYLGKYCKLTKKSNCLLNKIKTLEDSINIKSNELKESQDEYAKLEALLQIYKTERKGHQCLKKDRDFLLMALWKVLKRLEEEPREYKYKKITETFFKRFERELMDLKLEDFRYNKLKNVPRQTEKEESDFLFSPESQVSDSFKSDSINTNTNMGPESVKLSFEESDENCVAEGIKHMDLNRRMVDTDHQNDMENVEVNILKNQPLPLPDLSFEPFVSQDCEGGIDLNPQEKHILRDCACIDTSENNEENNGVNMFHYREGEDILTGSTSETLTQNNVQEQVECFQNYLNLKGECFPLESKDNLREEEKMSEQFRKTYCNKKFKASSQNDGIMKKKLTNNCQLTGTSLPNRANAISNAIGNSKSADIDVFNVSSETIRLDTDVSVEDIGSIPDHIQYCERIYDFLTSSGGTGQPKGKTCDETPHLLFLTENELVNKPSEVNVDTGKTLVQKSSKTLSVFDVEYSGNSMSSGYVRGQQLAKTCMEFNSDNGNTVDLREVVNKVCEVNEKNGFIEHDEISRKTGNENQIDEKSQNISNSSLKESSINCNSERFLDNTIENNFINSEFTQQESNISDEEVYRVLKDYKKVPLLSPLKEKKPNKRHKLIVLQNQKHDECNASQNITVMSNLKNMESCEEILHNRPNREKEILLCNPKTDKEKEKKMVDKFIQTDGKVVLEEQEEQQSNGMTRKVVFPENFVRKLCKIVWRRNLRKFKYLNRFSKMCKVHSSCFDFMKILLEMINNPILHFKNRTTENSDFKEKADQNKSNLKCDERKVSSWQVEDVDVTNVISKNEPPFNYHRVEDCSFFTQVPVRYYSKDSLNNSAVQSEETRNQKNKMSLNWFTTNQSLGFATPKGKELEIYSNTYGCNVCWECGIGSDIALRHRHSNDTVNDFEKRCETYAEAHDTTNDTTKNEENTRKSNFENVPEIDVICRSSDALNTKTDYLGKCVEVKKTEVQSGEACSETEESLLLLRRSSRIRSRNTLLMEEENRTNDHGLNLKESHDLMKCDIFRVSLPSINGNSTESYDTSSNENINDIVPVKEISEGSKCSRLKEKFEELFGKHESQTDCSSSESGEDLETILTPAEVQNQVPVNSQVNANRYTSDATAVSQKRRICCDNSKADSINKKMKWDLLSMGGNEDFEEGFTENEVPLNNTFSSQDIRIGNSSNILDSIMTAMTEQTEFFKAQTALKETEVSDVNYRCTPRPSQPKDCIPSSSVHRKISNECRMKGDNSVFLNLPYCWNIDNHFGNQTFQEKKGNNNSDGNHRQEAKLKSLVQKEIRKFMKLDINTVEEGEEKIKSCIAVLRKASESIIANVIVNEIMANVDEELKEFERPAPPLTQTQHRIMIILTVFSRSDEQFHRISSQILKIIWSKIFPENFFWPDDSLEMATRFYAALCKRLNNFKGIWKFCFKVITSMRQRWCIPILVVLQVWPDIIHNANEVQNNLLVKTFVTVILHTPKSEDMRRKRQEQKLLAIKHLLINFYNFDLNSTIEIFTQKLWESLVNKTRGSVDALVLISKCRNWSWTRKNIIAKLLETLESWMNGEADDIMFSEVLDILQQITTIFPDGNAAEASSAKDVISVLTQVLNTEKLNPMSEEKIIRILCSLCHYSDVRDILLRFLEKFSTSEPLHADIQKALSSKNRKCKEGYRKANAKIVPMQRRKTKQKKKKKRNSSRQKSEIDMKIT